MNWIDQIKNKIGRYLLMQSLSKNKSRHPIPTFDQIQDIGILYDAGSKENEEQVNRVAHYLRDQGKKVWTMGYVDSKKLPHTRKFHISSEYFWREKLTPFNLPDKTKIGTFITHPFDLMLNLYFENLLPLQALSCYSQAKYAMGAPLPDSLVYNDSTIDTGKDQNIQLLASQMVHYLKVINQK